MERFFSVLRLPDTVTVCFDGGEQTLPGSAAVNAGGARVEFFAEEGLLRIALTGGGTPVSLLRLRWKGRLPGGTRIMSGAWERGYGDLEWRGLVPERKLPWYFFASAGETTAGYGIRVQPAAFCWWQADPDGVTLGLDVRCGGEGVRLGGRTLEAATVLCREYPGCSAFDAEACFCGEMCPRPLLPDAPVYGGNNWYYAYGQSSYQEIVSDARELSRLTEGLPNRPFLVVDDGWQAQYGPGNNGGPWRRGNAAFPDMRALAGEMRERDVRPGIWLRLLADLGDAIPKEWRLSRCETVLDPSVPAVLEHVREDVSTLSGWGYRLIKHDFSTNDIFGGWNRIVEQMAGGWRFADSSRTTAEIILAFYRAVLESAGEAMILGCNCVTHLAAGLVHLNRTGDDVSGRHWERTRRMGVNTLAFTLPQHGRFYAIDADCAGLGDNLIPWELNRQWLALLAASGTPLFVSARPGGMTPEQEEALRKAYARASRQEDQAYPLDWMESTCPAEWEINGAYHRFCWYPDGGPGERLD